MLEHGRLLLGEAQGIRSAVELPHSSQKWA
jgi:hypothetical protein